MSRAVYKYPINIGQTLLHLPPGWRFLTVQEQNGAPWSWWLIDPTPDPHQPPEMVGLHVIATGHYLPDAIDAWEYLGTFQLDKGEFVGHLFRERPADWARQLVAGMWLEEGAEGDRETGR